MICLLIKNQCTIAGNKEDLSMTNIRLLERNIIWSITREPMNTGGSVVYWKDIVHILGAGKRKHHVTREEFTKNHFME